MSLFSKYELVIIGSHAIRKRRAFYFPLSRTLKGSASFGQTSATDESACHVHDYSSKVDYWTYQAIRDTGVPFIVRMYQSMTTDSPFWSAIGFGKTLSFLQRFRFF
jgi:hypothetical protein